MLNFGIFFFNCVIVDGELEKCGQGGFVVRHLHMCGGPVTSLRGTEPSF
jgi:hypothetical protein